ncbi:MAG: chemotaxis protein CheW [Pseudomonadota bacterium]
MLTYADTTAPEQTGQTSPFSVEDIAGTYLTFDLAGQVLGVDVTNVREILDQATVRLLPNAPHDIEGIVDIRGQSIPVVDMGSRLALPRQDDSEDTRIIVFEISRSGKVCPIGVVADKVRNVAQIPAEAIEAPPDTLESNWQGSVLRAVARQDDSLILLLDIAMVLGAEDAAFSTEFV